MPISWSALHAQYVRKTQSLRFFLCYSELRAGQRALQPLGSPQVLLTYMHGLHGTSEAKNHVLRALLPRRAEDRSVCCVLLTLALWPGLDNAFSRLRAGFRGDPQAVCDELISAFNIAMLKSDPDKGCKWAATLVRNAKRDATTALTKNKSFAAHLDAEIEERTEDAVGNDVGDGSVLDDQVGKELRRLLERDFGAGGALVYDVAVYGLSQRQAGNALGLNHGTARKRHTRTIERIRDERPDYLTPRVPLRAPDWHLSSEGTRQSGVAEDEADAGRQEPPGKASWAVPSLGTPGNPPDRRRVPARGRRGDN